MINKNKQPFICYQNNNDINVDFEEYFVYSPEHFICAALIINGMQWRIYVVIMQTMNDLQVSKSEGGCVEC